MEQKSKQRWVMMAVVLLLLGGGLSGYLLNGAGSETITQLPLVEGCQLDQKGCSATLPNGTVMQFEMTPKPLPTTEPIQMRASFSAGIPERVEVLFEGRDMYMGFLQYRLKPTAEVGVYQGKGSLSICTRRLMAWIAKVRVTQNGETVEIPFAFETLNL